MIHSMDVMMSNVLMIFFAFCIAVPIVNHFWPWIDTAKAMLVIAGIIFLVTMASFYK